MPKQMRRKHKYDSSLGPVNKRAPGFSDSSNRASGTLHQLQQALGNRALGHFIQGKLRISQPDDTYEQEADRVADQAHPLFVNLRTGLLFDPERPGVSLPLSVDLGIRHDRGFQVGINYTAVADLLNSGGWTHLIGLGLEVELP
jgi:hypothetical protein